MFKSFIKESDCNSSNVMFSGRYKRSKLSIDDESSHLINGSNTNNKIERKRNINMLLNDEDKKEKEVDCCDIGVNISVGGCDDNVHRKKIKIDDEQEDNNKRKMYQIYQPWVLRTYGDLSKSKTITLKKQSRILSALKGLESNRPDSSKFRFWVKSKGFVMDLPKDYQNSKQNQIVDDGCLLFIPSTKMDPNNSIVTYKRVAVVEYFFNIIYKVHCCVDEGEQQRHVGQKRTYRRITEYYAFLPREAVTKFLTQCNECRKSIKTTIVQEINENSNDEDNKNQRKTIENYLMLVKAFYDSTTTTTTISHDESHSSIKENLFTNQNDVNINNELNHSITGSDIGSSLNNIIINSLDVASKLSTNIITCDRDNDVNNSSTLINDNQQIVTSSSDEIDENCEDLCVVKQQKQFTRVLPDNILFDYHNIIRSYTTTTKDKKKCIEMKKNIVDIKPITSTYLSLTRSMGLTDEDALNLDSISSQQQQNDERNNESINNGIGGSVDDSYANMLKDADKLKLMLLAWNYQNSAAVRNGTSGPDLTTMASLWEQYQNAIGINNPVKLDNSTRSASPSNSQDDRNSPSDTKEEDDGSEDESDEKTDQTSYDPERLKAFNMFVRLFVDENLDRMIPISKQPKEKVQAIIDSCARQFPDFSERARKRLRTYLKSCRRNKKTKDGWENQPSRPTPAHLTSVQAEQILSIACENESMNAKRMRLGLEPISQSLNIPSSHSAEPPLYSTAKTSMDSLTTPLSISTTAVNCKTSPVISTTTDSNANSINSILSSTRPTVPPTNSPYDFSTSSFMQNKSNNATSISGYYNSVLGASIAQGPTDLSVKRPLLPHNLNVSEAAAVKQLITGYREAAAFLLRSADELEQLLINQPQ